MELYPGMVDEYNQQQLDIKDHKSQLRKTGDTVGRLSNTSWQQLIKMKELKDQNNRYATKVADEELYMM